MQKVWSDLAWEQLQDWSARDRKTLKRIYALITHLPFLFIYSIGRIIDSMNAISSGERPYFL